MYEQFRNITSTRQVYQEFQLDVNYLFLTDSAEKNVKATL